MHPVPHPTNSIRREIAVNKFQHWMKYGVLTSALTVIPLQAASAFAPQWRPAEMAPALNPAVVAMPGRDGAQFRPVAMYPDAPVPSPRFTMPPRFVQPSPPPAPAFARQYGWRPAPQPWLARPQQPAMPAAPAMPMPVAGQWRPAPVYQPYPQQPPQAPQPPVLASSFPQGSWRPVEPPQQAPYPVAPSMPVMPSMPYSYRPLQPRQPRMPSAPAYPTPYQPGLYSMSPPPMPYMPPPFPAPRLPATQPFGMPMAQPWSPYGMPVPSPYWAMPYQGMMPFSPYVAAPGWDMPALPESGYLAGCPGCSF